MDSLSRTTKEYALIAATEIGNHLFISRKEFRTAFQNMDDAEHIRLYDFMVREILTAIKRTQGESVRTTGQCSIGKRTSIGGGEDATEGGGGTTSDA